MPVAGGHLGTMTLRLLGRIWLDLMATVEAPDDQPDLGSGGVAKRHWGAAVGLHDDNARRSLGL